MSIHRMGGSILYIKKENVTARDYIMQALLTLLEKKEFETITVKQIVEKAGISRSAYYTHFEDKYKLMDCLRREITFKFISFYSGEGETVTTSIHAITKQICQHIFQYRNFYKHEFNHPEYTQQLSDLLTDRLEEVYKDRSYATFASYGTIGYLTHWVKGNFLMKPAEAAEELVKIGMTDWSKG